MKMKVYTKLTPAMRKRLKYNLDSGKKTPEEIEHNVAETLILYPYPAEVSLWDTIEFQVIYFLKQWKKNTTDSFRKRMKRSRSHNGRHRGKMVQRKND